jgi:hypothetical protein
VSIDRGDGSTVSSFERGFFARVEHDQPIRTPARDMCVGPDPNSSWREIKVSVLDQPKLGQRDYAARRFTLSENGKEKASASFEVVVYNDHETAARVFAGTLERMSFLRLARLDLGDMAAFIEAPGHPSRKMRALIFAKRNVMGMIMLSTSLDQNIPDHWIIDKGRIMASRMA